MRVKAYWVDDAGQPCSEVLEIEVKTIFRNLGLSIYMESCEFVKLTERPVGLRVTTLDDKPLWFHTAESLVPYGSDRIFPGDTITFRSTLDE